MSGVESKVELKESKGDGPLVYVSKAGDKFLLAGDTGAVQITFAWIKPDAAPKAEEIIARIKKEGFDVVAQKTTTMDMALAAEFYAEHKERSFFPDLAKYMCSGPAVALALRRVDAIKAWRDLAGPTDAKAAKSSHPQSIRALFGVDKSTNAVHGSDSVQAAQRELNLVFNSHSGNVQTTYAMIKPDAVKAGSVDGIIKRIKDEGFEIVHQQTFQLTKENAAAFYAEHAQQKWFGELSDFITSGPVVALALRKKDAVKAWRALIGPTDSNAARSSAPTSIRAAFGKDKQQNAVHGSDSVESAAREVNLVFGSFLQTTYAMVKPDAFGHAGAIIKRIQEEGFEVVQQAELRLTVEQAQEFYVEHKARGFYNDLVAYMTSGPVVGLALRKVDAIKAWRDLAGPTDAKAAKESAPKSIRAQYGVDKSTNAVHGSDAPEAAAREIGLVFGKFAANNVQTTFAWIKPDAVAAKHTDAILARIRAEGFEIVKKCTLTQTEAQARQFYAEHKDRSWFPELAKFVTSGPAVALALRKANAIKAWRDLAGPTDSKQARETSPVSIRALFGADKQCNAVHGSDSVAAAAREVELVFGTFTNGVQSTFAFLKPEVVAAGKTEAALRRIREDGFEIVRQQEGKLSSDGAKQFYAEHASKGWFHELEAYMTGGNVLALELRKENAIAEWRELCGPTDSNAARASAPTSMRALFGKDKQQNAVHGSDSKEAAEREIKLVFETLFKKA